MNPTRPLPVLAAALAAVLAGCASPGHYARQVRPIEVPAQYGRGDAALNAPVAPLAAADAAPDGEPAADPWWRGFGDARLDRMVERVLEVNADLASAGFALRQARLEARLAGNDLWPQPGAGVNASGSRRIDTGDDVVRSYDASVQLSWEVDLFGKLRAQRDVSTWQAHASAEDLQATALALAGETCRHYWDLAYLNQSIAAGEKDLAELERIVQLVRVQHATGELSRLEVREAEQNLESRRASQSALLQQRVETRNAIAVLLDGQPWPAQDEPQDLGAASGLWVDEGLPAELLGRRPDLRAAELRLRASLAGVHATARSYYPALSLTGTVGGGSASLSDVLRDPVATLGAGLTLPFLNVVRMRTDTEIAGTAYLEAASGFRTTLHTALQEVDNALSAREQSQLQVEARTRSHDAARDIARMYEVRYRAGASALRIWLDARQVLRSSELSLAQARRDQLDGDVTLVLALGGSGGR